MTDTDPKTTSRTDGEMPSRSDPRRGDTLAPNAAAATPRAAVVTPDAGEDEPMQPKQADVLRALCREKGEPFDPGLSRAEADRRIEELSEA